MDEQIASATPSELQIMIANRLGWTTTEWLKEHFPDENVPILWVNPAGQYGVELPSWPNDMNLAWELEVEGGFWEMHDSATGMGVSVSVSTEDGETLAATWEPWRKTKAQTYATARCRVWLYIMEDK